VAGPGASCERRGASGVRNRACARAPRAPRAHLQQQPEQQPERARVAVRAVARQPRRAQAGERGALELVDAAAEGLAQTGCTERAKATARAAALRAVRGGRVGARRRRPRRRALGVVRRERGHADAAVVGDARVVENERSWRHLQQQRALGQVPNGHETFALARQVHEAKWQRRHREPN
jgi:hypothetical protein